MITDFYCCDKCCKLKKLLDDYIYPLTRLSKYPEYDDVQRMLNNFVRKQRLIYTGVAKRKACMKT